jgi:hypothetical protein
MPMPTVPNQQRSSEALPAIYLSLWAGLECGVCGGAAILLWYIVHSVAHGEFWWAKLNVAAEMFFGSAVYRVGPGHVTVIGSALLLLFYSIGGVLFGALIRERGRASVSLVAPVYAVLIHFIATYKLLPGLDLFAASWFPAGATVPAHLLFLFALVLYPLAYRKLQSGRDGVSAAA